MATQTQNQTPSPNPGSRGYGGSVIPASWDLAADVVIIGAGGAGLPASLAARDSGASVLVVDANYDVGGHSMMSGGMIHIGGGNAGQTASGVTDSPDLVFSDLTDWTIVQPNGWPDYRYNDRGFCRAFADNCVATYNLLIANGYKYTGGCTDSGEHNTGNSASRSFTPVAAPTTANAYAPNAAGGTMYARPLEASARTNGVQFLLNYHMDSIVRASSGSVVGVVAHYTGGRIMPGSGTPLQSYAAIQGLPGNINMTKAEVSIWANKGVIIATGGHTSNVDFRRIFDPRLTAHVARIGDPYSFTDGSGELAAMEIGASLWGALGNLAEEADRLTAPSLIGVRYPTSYQQTSPIFPLLGGTGLTASNKQDIILVNQVGQRFYDETKGGYATGNVGPTGATNVSPYTPDDYLTAQYITSSTPPGKPYDATDYNLINAALAVNSGSVAPDFSAGPVWAIFDADAVTREKWTVTSPYVDTAGGYFFSADTLTDLAAALSYNPYQTTPMSGTTLQATVTRYNSFVDSGVDSDFGKPKPAYKIQTPPFYAGYTAVGVHDTRAGLRVNMKFQVVDRYGQVIPHLYCAGESAGGINQHGLGRVPVGGYIAAKNAVLESPIA